MQWPNRLKNIWQTLNGGRDEASSGPAESWAPARSWHDVLRMNVLGRNWEMEQVQEEVAAEGRRLVVCASRDSHLNDRLVAQLRQQPQNQSYDAVQREGLFTLLHLPTPPEPTSSDASQAGISTGAANDDTSSYSNAWEAADLLLSAEGADCVLYLWWWEAGWQPADMQWYARLRASGGALLPVAVGPAAMWSSAGQQQIERLRRQLGVRPVLVRGDSPAATSETELSPDLVVLVERLLALRPRLALALAQEAPGCRSMVLQRVIRTGALMAAMMGAEPLPLLDLPLHVMVNWKLALQIATIYGRPGLDYRSREMVGALLFNLCIRQGVQQVVKLAPGVGWLLSCGLSGLSTWWLGTTLVRYYEHDQRLAVGWPRLNTSAWRTVAQRPWQAGQELIKRWRGWPAGRTTSTSMEEKP